MFYAIDKEILNIFSGVTDEDDIAVDHTLTIKPPQARVHKSRHKATSHHKHSKVIYTYIIQNYTPFNKHTTNFLIFFFCI